MVKPKKLKTNDTNQENNKIKNEKDSSNEKI